MTLLGRGSRPLRLSRPVRPQASHSRVRAAGWRPLRGRRAALRICLAAPCVKGVRPWGFAGTWAPTATGVWGVKLMMAAVAACQVRRTDIQGRRHEQLHASRPHRCFTFVLFPSDPPMDWFAS
jgi:hypothetical protein